MLPSTVLGEETPDPETNPGHDINKPHIRFDPQEMRLKMARAKFKASAVDKSREGNMELGGSNESSVDINPLDSMNVAYASCVELRVSNDGGATFETPVLALFPPTHSLAGDPVVLFDNEGRLFWQYLGYLVNGNGLDAFIAQCDPETGDIMEGYPINITVQAGHSGDYGHYNDKPWMVVDRWSGSPYENALYMAWTDIYSGTNIYTTRSVDQGLTWSYSTRLTYTSSVFDWPVHMAVAQNGDVYCTEHYSHLSNARVRMFRSTNGGVSYSGVGDPFPAGTAYMGFNRQTSTNTPGTDFLFLGSFQSWILPDPTDSASLWVVTNADPTGSIGQGDDGNIYIVHSSNSGQTWTSPQRVDHDPGESLQIFPTAAIDPDNGSIVVTWYDAREGNLNDNNNYLLNTYATISFDGGATFVQDFRVDDEPFDPDAGSMCYYDCGFNYYGAWMADSGVAYACGDELCFWDGTTWTTVNPGVSTVFYDVWGVDENAVWLVGVGGYVLFYNGQYWSPQSGGAGVDLTSVAGRTADDVYAVGMNGVIIHWDGSSWTTEASGTTQDLWNVWAVPGGSVWAVGEGGTVVRNSGSGWNSVPSIATGELLSGVWAATDDEVWAMGINTGIHRWDGSAWTNMETGIWYGRSVWGASQNSVYFGGWGQVFHWDGSEFTQTSYCEQMTTSLGGNSDSDIMAVGKQGVIGQFNGTSWELLDNPGLTDNPTYRIGEYNGVAASGLRAVTTWTGNTRNDQNEAVDQQSLFDEFVLDPALVSVPFDEVSSLVFLEPGQPNPFRWITRFSYSLPKSGMVKCAVYDIRGHLVKEIQAGVLSDGMHIQTWDGRDETGSTVSTGVYFLRLEVADQLHTQKLTLIR